MTACVGKGFKRLAIVNLDQPGDKSKSIEAVTSKHMLNECMHEPVLHRVPLIESV